MALARAGEFDQIPSDIYIKHHRNLHQIHNESAALPPDLNLNHLEKVGIWYYGETGVGKTRLAVKEYPDAYRKMANNKWWDSYQGEEHVLIDDLDKAHHYMGYYLKIWADRYAFVAEIKGTTRLIRPKKIIVTSNYHPKEIWDDLSTLDPIKRRFRIVHVCGFLQALGLDQDEEQLVPDFS